MKQSFARQPSHHRNRTPSVICLPPPKPPVAAKRAEPVAPAAPEAAMALPETPEPLVTERAATEPAEVQGPQPQSLNRQARRKAQRAEAKAMRRQGHAPAPPAPFPPMPEPEPQAVLELDTLAPAPAGPDAEAPLPPARALVAARPRGLAGFAHRLRVMIGLKRADTMPAGQGAITGQLRALRKELAALQQSVDRILDGAAA